ncbi:2-nitropropane dioxygenase [Neobacillus piezotolerans]|uniref:Probable nitronate monooxygenase n=1 Tax=Neobacillus piezotolerans TaxID=2259171 RepID=A0A3D8GNA1_9BACI|nr:nitronate monooxygenase [Neobacillus piezotolerans]RDU35797.1 2-nitropropane dioxygenase [Neobacillus piezotolerans]
MNKLANLLGIRFPIIQGGMGNISNAELAAAVSEAGGLGTIGSGTMDPDEVEAIIMETKSRTGQPFCVNVPLGVSPYSKEILALVLKHGVPVVSLSAGNPAPYIPKLRGEGVKVLSVIASVKHAIKAEEAGTDAVVAEGYEAAGINSPFETTTMALIPQVAGAVDIPVVGAGGIADGRGLAAALALGASGAQMGTRFIAVKEAPFHAIYKHLVTNAEDTSTVIVGRGVGRIRRLLDTPYARKLIVEERNGISLKEFMDMTAENYHKLGAIEGNLENGFLNAGQIAGLISDIPSTAELFERMVEEAKIALESATLKLF